MCRSSGNVLNAEGRFTNNIGMYVLLYAPFPFREIMRTAYAKIELSSVVLSVAALNTTELPAIAAIHSHVG